jgi:hypothetical protein
MPRSATGWILTLGVPVLAIAIGVLLTGGGSSAPNAKAEAAAVCTNAQLEVEQLPKSPRSIAEGLEIEHGLVSTMGESYLNCSNSRRISATRFRPELQPTNPSLLGFPR